MLRSIPVRGAAAALVCLAVLVPLGADERIDQDVNARIRREAGERSQIMPTLHVLTDVYGPRVTGAPSLKAAGAWAVKQMESWGLVNGRLEPWNFGRPGWVNERATAHVISPFKDQLVIEVLAWTPGTRGTVVAPAFHLDPPARVTEAELNAFLDARRHDVKGRIVLAGAHRAVSVNLNPPAKRRDDERLREQFDPSRQSDAAAGRGGRGRGRGQAPAGPAPLSSAEISRRIDQFLLASGARLRINDAGREHGQIVAFSNPTYDVARTVPTVVMRNEDYGRIARVLAGGTPVELEFNIVNATYEEGRTAYTALAEIPGTDKRDEVVMLGGHLDSWQSATGATDNAIGCAVMMEAVRIVNALGLQPRRTIRVALWSGEEQGLLGSQAYVAQHFGSQESPRADFAKLVAYLNLDNGTGRIRGANVFGPPAAATVLRELLAPFADLGLVGAMGTASRNLGGTDSTSFNNAGLPGINFVQDPIEYETHTHHTNLDTYERVMPDDVKSSAAAIASVVYHLAMRDEMLPRFTPEAMPAAPARR